MKNLHGCIDLISHQVVEFKSRVIKESKKLHQEDKMLSGILAIV